MTRMPINYDNNSPFDSKSSALLKTPSSIKSALKSSFSTNQSGNSSKSSIKGVKINNDPPSVRVYKVDDSFSSNSSLMKENIE